MSTLTVGRLVGYVEMVHKDWDRGAKSVDQTMHQMRRDTLQVLQQITNDFQRLGREAGEGLGSGITETADRELDQARRTLGASGERAGTEVGEGITDGAARGMDGLDKAGDGPMRKLGGKLKTGAAGAGLVAGAALTEAFTSGLDLEVATDKLSAQLLLTEQESKVAGDVAGALFADAYGESMEDVTHAVAAVMSSFDGMREATAEDLQAVTAKALDLANALEIDVADAAQHAATLIGSGLARDAEEAFDLIAAAAAKVPLALREDLLEASDEYAQFFRSLGFDGRRAFSLLVQASGKGTYGIDKMGDSLKEFLLLSTDLGSTSVLDAYKAIGVDARKSSNAILAGGEDAQRAFQKIVAGLLGIKDPSQQAAAAIGLFGTPLEDLNKADIPEFLSMMQRSSEGLRDVEGSAGRMGQVLNDNAKTDFTAWYRSLKQNVVDYISDEAIPKLRQLGQNADFQAIADEVGKVAGRVRELWDQMVADVREWADENEDEIREGLAEAREYLEAFLGAMQAMIDAGQAAWDAGGKEMLTTILAFLRSILTIVRGVLQMVQGIFQVFTALLTGDWELFWRGLQNIVEGFGNTIKGAVGGLAAAVVAILRGMRSLAEEQWTRLTSMMLTALSLIITGAAQAFSWIPGIGPQLVAAARDFEAFRDRTNAALAGIRPVRIPVNFIGSASGVAPRVVLGAMQHYADGGTIGAGGIGEVAERGPEMFTVGGRRYLLNGDQPGRITPSHALAGSGAAAGGSAITVQFDGRGLSGLDMAVWEWLQSRVQLTGGGDVQRALGGRRR